MQRLVLGCAIALPLSLACDTQPSPEPSNELAEVGVDAEPAGHAQGLAAPHHAPGAEHECEGEAPAAVAPTLAAASTAVDPALLRELDNTNRPVRGGDAAKVEIIVFSDFACPFCAKLAPSLDAVLMTYGDDVSLTFKQMPLPFHQSAEPAARASLAAQEQGKFWEMHDVLFANPSRVHAREFSAIAAELGMDVTQFERDMENPELAARVQRDAEDAKLLGIRGTPSIVIGDKLVVGAQPVARILPVIDAELAAG